MSLDLIQVLEMITPSLVFGKALYFYRFDSTGVIYQHKWIENSQKSVQKYI